MILVVFYDYKCDAYRTEKQRETSSLLFGGGGALFLDAQKL